MHQSSIFTVVWHATELGGTSKTVKILITSQTIYSVICLIIITMEVLSIVVVLKLNSPHMHYTTITLCRYYQSSNRTNAVVNLKCQIHSLESPGCKIVTRAMCRLGVWFNQ